MTAFLPMSPAAIGQEADGLVVSALDNESITPQTLAEQLAGAGVEVDNVNYFGADPAAGIFSGGAGIVGFESGILLTSGAATSVVGPNQSDSTTTAYGDGAGGPGDTDLDSLIDGTTSDASVLEFDFVPQGDLVTFQYVFGSEEYNEFVDQGFDDVFAFFVNGTNCATVGDGDRVSINTINNGTNSELYIDNELPDDILNIELDGLTVVLTCSASVDAGVTNHLKLAIADAGDASYDSAVFLQTASLVSGDVDLSIEKSTESSTVMVGDTVTYDITVTNNSEEASASGVTVVDTLTGPGEIQSVSDEDCAVAEDAMSAQCDLGSLEPGEQRALTLTVRATEEGTLNNSVAVTSAEADTNPEDNQSAADPVDVAAAPSEDQVDLSITKTDQPDPVTVDQKVAYEITVINNGEDGASDVTVLDDADGGSILSGSGDGWECGSFEGPFACSLSGELAAGATAPLLTILVEAPSGPGSITNTAQVFSNQDDANNEDNTAIEETTVVESSEEGVTGFLEPGDELVTDDGVTGPDNPVSAKIIIPEDGTPGVYTLSEFTDEAAIGKGAVEYTGPDPSEPFLIQVSCDESKCPIRSRDTFILVQKFNPDGSEQVLPSCESIVRVKGKPTVVSNPPPCVVSVVRAPLSAEVNPGDLVWTVRVFGADPIIRAR